jgi:hypothetical protein
MKTWLTKWRISNALDERKPLPPAVERAMAGSAELRRFAVNAATVDQALTKTRHQPTAPASLHAAIMRAVRSSGSSDHSGWQNFWPRLIPASALTLLILLSVFGVHWFSRPPANLSPVAEASSLAMASSALEIGGNLVRAMPGEALSPLSDEMIRLNRDLTNAQNFLLASLP